MSFIVFSLPRSRSAWLSHFLTYGDWVCGHEQLRHMRSLDDVRAWFSQPNIGTAETAAGPWWRLLDEYAPGAKVVVVRRPPDEVVESLLRIPGVAFDRSLLEQIIWRYDRKLDQIERRLPGVLSVGFSDLEQEETCAAVFEHCLPYQHDSARWAQLSQVNVQINFPALLRYWNAYQPALDKLAKVAKHRTIAALGQRLRAQSGDGLTFQVEGFDAWRRDGRSLFEEHCVLVGEPPDQWEKKNIAVMQALDGIGAMQITTARCNGRMFGYLMTLISPSLEEVGLMSAANTTFFASPLFPGLGLKLQRAAIETLRARGVGELVFHAGVRGDGPRMGSLYRRLGAVPHGDLYRLKLSEA